MFLLVVSEPVKLTYSCWSNSHIIYIETRVRQEIISKGFKINIISKYPLDLDIFFHLKNIWSNLWCRVGNRVIITLKQVLIIFQKI